MITKVDVSSTSISLVPLDLGVSTSTFSLHSARFPQSQFPENNELDMATIADVPGIREAIFHDDAKAKRIVMTVKTKHLDPQDYRGSAYKYISEVFPDWETDSRILFLAIEVWGHRAFLAIDINHHDYDYDTAHKSTSVLPVYVLRKHGKRPVWALIRWPREDHSLTMRLADLHNAVGFDCPTPFLQDHNARIVSVTPRHLSERADTKCPGGI